MKHYILALAVLTQGASGALCAADSPTIFPPPKSVSKVPYQVGCSLQHDVAFDNSDFVDPDGPIGVANASACCAACAAKDGCNYWSFNLDEGNFPHLPVAQCKWASLSYCCFFHTTDANRTVSPKSSPNQFGAQGKWTSGTISTPTAPTNLTRSLLSITEHTPIKYNDKSLESMATVLSEELFVLSGFLLTPTAMTKENDNDKDDTLPSITLSVASARNTSRSREYYTVSVDGTGAHVECETTVGCAWGSVSLLSSLCVGGVGAEEVAINAVEIEDYPNTEYRALMVDLARTQVSIGDLKAAISFCRFYKVPYLHLHFTDDHSWTFPSTAFPKLGTDNMGFHGPKPFVYKKQDLIDLVAFGDARGVTLIPELEGPGHSGAMRRSDPSFQGAGGDIPGMGGVINAASEEVYQKMTTLLSEYAEIFTSSPYIHIGCDETTMTSDLPGYADFAQKHNISSPGDLFGYYVKFMSDEVKKLGKKAIVWEGAGLGRLNPGDAVVLIWQGDYVTADNALKLGLEVVNCPFINKNATQEYNRSILHWSGGENNLEMRRDECGWDSVNSFASQLLETPRPRSPALEPHHSQTQSPRNFLGVEEDEQQRNKDDNTPLNPLIIGVEAQFWEMGWRYESQLLLPSAVARLGGTGWQAGDARGDWDAAGFASKWEVTRSRLWPLDKIVVDEF